MESNEKWQFISELDEKYLIGGVIISEWTACLVRDADGAYCAGSNLAAILAAQAAIECHLRYEYSGFHSGRRLSFYDVIEQSPIDKWLKINLHKLRTFRNRWVHVNEPHNDSELLERADYHELELEEFAKFTIEQLRCVIYLEQFT